MKGDGGFSFFSTEQVTMTFGVLGWCCKGEGY